MTDATVRVWPQDLSAVGYCHRGARRFFRRHALDWPAFLRTGIAADRLLATGDYMAERLVAQARGRHEHKA